MNSSPLRLALLILAVAFSSLRSWAQANLAQPPGQISFQAFLTDANGTPLATNTPQNYNVTFNIYPAATGGTALWGESQTVTVSQGYFTVLLGAGNAIPSSTTPHTSDLTYLFNTNNAQTRYVGLTVAGVGSGEIAPRLQMQSAPFALLAANAINAVNATNILGANTITKGNLALDIGVWTANAADVYRPGGNVGIGTSVPGAPLEVHAYGSQLRLTGGDFGNAALDLSASGPGAGWYGAIQSRTVDGTSGTWFPLLLNPNGGNVGMGTANPISALGYPLGWNGLHLKTATNSAVGLAIIQGSTGGRLHLRNDSGTNNFTQDFVIDNTANRINFGWLGSGLGNRVNAITIDSIGRVGVGTTTPTQARLAVMGTGGSFTSAFNYFNANSTVISTSAGSQTRTDIGIYSDSQIGGTSFFAFSDRRIKHVIGRSDSAGDLQALQGIEITDFTYRDQIAHDSRIHKKVIAQQVEQVFPQAVSTNTDIVPDIYKAAAIKEGWVQLATDLKVGDRVRLITDRAAEVHTVLETREGAFRTELAETSEKVFVYGREVKDFRVVDYEALAMLNVSATQELAKQLAARTAELTALQDTVAKDHAELARLRGEKDKLAGHLTALESRDAEREARLRKLENSLVTQPYRTERASLNEE